MKWLMILVFFCSCQDFNSNTDDAEGVPEAALASAYSVLKDKCMNCHTSNIHQGWKQYLTSQKWMDVGLVVAGSAVDSKLIRKLKVWGDPAEGNMPSPGDAISQTEYETLRDWINTL